MPAFRNQTEIGKQLASVADHFVECCIKREDVAENGGDDQSEWNRTDNEVESDSRCIQKYIFSDNQTDGLLDRKSTRLNSSHVAISYAVCCLKKKIITSTR